METNEVPIAFELTDEFCGFVFTDEGKRRMVLRVDGADCLFKVPRLIRRRVIGTLRPGQTVRVTGTEERSGFDGPVKRIVSRIVPVEEVTLAQAERPTRAICTIRVCAKKNCWRSGGRELWTALEQEVASRGLADAVKLKAVGCLERCKQAPNADSDGREYRHCRPRDARAMITEATPRLALVASAHATED